MLTSKRQFGVEIEFVAPNERAMESIRDRITVVRDGSLDPLPYAGEYVSEPLSGKRGEETVKQACEVLKKYGAGCESNKTSVHVHLDGRARPPILRSTSDFEVAKKQSNVIGVSNRIKKYLSSDVLLTLASRPRGAHYHFQDCIITEMEGVTFYSLAVLTRRPKINYTYYWLEREDKFDWLRNVFYFYTKFSPVMQMIVSNSRRHGNMYCIPLHKSYDLEHIEKATNIEELKSVWYKGRTPNGHYDDSRYHNVNLHCFWDRHGTVEIRSHGGTISPYKILLWVKTHQKIVDKLEEVSIEDLMKLEGTPKEFVEFLEDNLLEDYVKRLLGYYSGIKLK